MLSTRLNPKGEEDQVILRSMTEEDLVSVVDLSNRVLESYAGTNIRTVEDFRWRCLDRPGVEPSGSFVAISDDAIVGYVVVRTNGEVLDCIVERISCSGRVMDLLLTEAERFAVGAGATRILVNLPADRSDLRGEAESAGFASAPATNLYLGPKDLPRLLERLHATSGAGGRCDLYFDVRAPVESENVSFRLKCGVVSKEPGAMAGIRITVARGALSAILLSGGSVLGAVARREMSVRPFAALPIVASVLRRLANPDPWFFNRSDIL